MTTRAYGAKGQSADFLPKLKNLVKACCLFYIPDEKIGYCPDFSQPVLAETSWIRSIKEYMKACKKIKKINIKGLEETYNLLSDNFSKEMFLSVVVFRFVFNCPKIRFPLFYSNEFQKTYPFYDLRVEEGDEKYTQTLSTGDVLRKYNLLFRNYLIKLIYYEFGLYSCFYKEQYRYQNIVDVKEGDYVIDAGACYGDTALYFAAKTNGKGKVFSFEFMPDSIQLFEKNMNFNPELKKNIVLVNNALSESSGKELFSVSSGSAAGVSTSKEEHSIKITGLSIDDFVTQNKIEKMNFIKMDIEGSELGALKGAVETIKKFKPQMAICLYHKDEDFWTIPQFIKEICPEYNLYLDHHSCGLYETVLYATV